MLQHLNITNFKRLKTANLGFSRINVLVGPNGAGKSSVIHLLTLFKQSVANGRGQLLYIGPYVELGNFKDVAFMHEASSITATLSFTLTKREISRIDRVLRDVPHLQLKVNKRFGKKRHKVNMKLKLSWGENGFEEQSIFLNDSLLISSKKRKDEPADTFPSDLISSSGMNVSSNRSVLCGWSIGGVASKVGEIRKITAAVRLIVWNRFHRFHPLLVSRGLTRHQYELSRSIPEEIGSREIQQVGSQVANTLIYMLGKAKHEQVLERIVKWASEFGVEIRPNLLNEYKVSVEGLDEQLRVWNNIVLHGFGVNQLLPVIVQGLMMAPHSILLVEEPEIHLHPRHQAKLVEFFLDITSSSSRQVLITTHSEHIILRLQRRVAEGKLNPSDLRIYYFDNLKGETKITRIELDQYGALKRWVPGFFEEGFEESLAQLRASLEKAKKAARK